MQTIELLLLAFHSEDVDIDAFYSEYVHPDFVSWDSRSAVPGDFT